MKRMIDTISKLSNIIVQMEEEAKDQYNLAGLTLTQMHYLEVINLLGNPSLTELAHELKLSKPTVKVALDKLTEKDFVYKVQSDQDRRSAHIHLSEKGKLINQMHEFAHKRIAEIFDRKLNAIERDTLIELINKAIN